MALYYYSKDRPAEELRATHTTLFQSRPGEESLSNPTTFRETIKRFVPPIVLDVTRGRRKKTS